MENARTVLPRIPVETQIRERYRGCLLGGAVGDALGAAVEFMPRQEIVRRFGEPGIQDYVPAYGRTGAITDDTQMTLFTADGLLRAHVRSVLRGIDASYAGVTAHAYLRWLDTQGMRSPLLLSDGPQGWLITHRELFSRRAPGRTCISALQELRSFDNPAQNNSKGCGGVMRVAPVGMYFANTVANSKNPIEVLRHTFRLGTQIAAITHGHPSGQLPAGALSVLIASLLAGNMFNTALRQAMEILAEHSDSRETVDAMELARTLVTERTQPKDAIRAIGEGWIAEEALAIAIYCTLVSTDLESGIVLAVNHDGDSDSTGAIAGHLLGAMHGAAAIPDRWLQPLELRDTIVAAADDLATVTDWMLDDEAEAQFYWDRYPGY